MQLSLYMFYNIINDHKINTDSPYRYEYMPHGLCCWQKGCGLFFGTIADV